MFRALFGGAGGVHSMLSRRNRICPTRPLNFIGFPWIVGRLWELQATIPEGFWGLG